MSPGKTHHRSSALSRRLQRLTEATRNSALGRRIRSLDRRQKIMSGAASGTVLVAVIALVAVTAFGGSAPPRPHHHHHKTEQPAKTVASTPPKKHFNLCPLTGTPPPHGKIPQRPAIGVKIGNDPASRPQSGLPHADIVYEEMAEGGITRYLAIFQCHQAPALGPTRSVRWDDWHVLKAYGHPILAFSGGINMWNTIVSRQHWLYDANGSYFPGARAYYRTSNRVAPWNYYTSTKRLWALDKVHTPPPEQFPYRATLQPGFKKASRVTIVNFAAGQSVVWEWNPKGGVWERYYGSSPDRDASGVQLHARNVVIQMVKTHPGPYAESGNVPDTDSITHGHGPAYIFRNGHFTKGWWRTPRLRDPMGLYYEHGKRIALSPGNTWVEMVPYGYKVNVKR